jgi:hypothetical protein
MTSIFLSHNWADKEFTRRLARDLQKAGARVWLDEAEIKLGESLISKIREGIDSVEYVGVILSPTSAKSEWVQREVDIAMNQEIEGKKVKVIPILHKRCDLPGFLKGKLYADMTSEADYAAALPKILDRLGLSSPKQIEIPRRIYKMFYETRLPFDKIIAELEALGASRASAREWALRWLTTIEHGND